MFTVSGFNNEYRNMHKKWPSILLMICSMVFMTRSTADGQSANAGQPGEFLRYGVGPRALGMGHAFTGLADDASTIYWNPAGLMNVERKQFTSMYSNLFIDSRYSFLALALPRTLVGAENGVGIAWVNLSMSDFDERDYDNIHLGNFDIYEQAFILAGAREWVSTWGILNYGLNLKLVNQGFPGYTSEQGWGFGADAGMTFRPMNLPIFRRGLMNEWFSLRRVMPLQIGLSLQNLLPPQIGFGDGEKDRYPFVLRWGASYHFDVSTWRFNILYDQEYFRGRDLGHFVGAEAVVPPPFPSMYPRLRSGWNSRAKAFTIGGGLKLDYISNAALGIDFAYAFKPDEGLENDFRLFLTVDFGQSTGKDYFYSRVETEETNQKKKIDHLQVISRYPHDLIAASAEALGSVYDTTNVVRYYALIGGLKLANEYFIRAKTELKNDKTAAAQNLAQKAAMEYQKAFVKNAADMSDAELLNYGESLIILTQYQTAADTVLKAVETPSPRRDYLMAVSAKFQQKWEAAADHFRRVVKTDENAPQSMSALSLLGLGESLMALQNYRAAADTFEVITHRYYHNLHPDYPRYPSYQDDRARKINAIADDAQFLLGECHAALGENSDAAEAFAKVSRFYPFSTRLVEANERLRRYLTEEK